MDDDDVEFVELIVSHRSASSSLPGPSPSASTCCAGCRRMRVGGHRCGGRGHGRRGRVQLVQPDRAPSGRARRELGPVCGRRLAARCYSFGEEPAAAEAERRCAVAAEGDGRDRGPPLLAARCARLSGIVRAVYSDDERPAGSQGGSTITQQLVAQPLHRRRAADVSRKLKEACLALKLARRWRRSGSSPPTSTRCTTASHAYGAQAGAQTYFSRRAAADAGRRRRSSPGCRRRRRSYDPFRHPDGRARSAQRGAARDAREPRPHHARAVRAGRLSAARPAVRDGCTPMQAPELLRLGRAAARAHASARGASRPAASGYGRRSTRACRTTRRAAIASTLAARDRPGGGAGRDRPGTGAVKAMARLRARAGTAAVQPRHAEPPHGRQRLQAVRARDRDRARHLALLAPSPGRR